MVRWYSNLTSGDYCLSKKHGLINHDDNIFIFRERFDPYQKITIRSYAYFNSIVSFIDAMSISNSGVKPSIPYMQIMNIKPAFRPSLWSYHEIIPEGGRKIFFDIDGEGAQDLMPLVRLLVELVKQFLFNRHQIVLHEHTDLVICSSSNIVKQSYHIIVNNYYVQSSAENLIIAKYVKQRLPTEWQDYIDTGVYSRLHNLRLLGYCKLESQRVKRILSSWTNYQGRQIQLTYPEIPESAEHELILQYQLTTITNIAKCRPLLRQIILQEPNIINGIDIPEVEVQNLYQAVPEYESFKISGVKPGLVTLRRMRAAFCLLCERSHDHENSYITVNQEGKAYWHCYRNKDRKLPLQAEVKIEEPEEPIASEIEIEYQLNTQPLGPPVLLGGVPVQLQCLRDSSASYEVVPQAPESKSMLRDLHSQVLAEVIPSASDMLT